MSTPSEVLTFQVIAEEMVHRGIPVIPLPPRQKGATLRNWQKLATTDASQIKSWNDENPQYNCGAVAKPNGVWILDCDLPTLPQLIEKETGQTFPATFTVQTSKGLHSYFRQTDPSRRMGNKKAAGKFDAQVNNKYVVAPGSIHPSGKRYEVVDGCDIAPAPDWLIQWIIHQSKKTSRALAVPSTEEKVAEGGRDTFLFTQACRLRDRGMSKSEALDALTSINSDRCVSPLSESVVCQKIDSAFTRSPHQMATDGFPLTDSGNAERFSREHRDSVRYCHELRKWFVWDGRRWTKDDTGCVYRMAKETSRRMLVEAATLEDDKAREKLIKHELKSESKQRIEAMLALAQNEVSIPVCVNDFDRDPLLLNCLNGSLDLRTLELRKHRREDLITGLCPVNYDPQAQCPRWLIFLDQITGQDSKLVEYLQRCVGYSLTGETEEHAMFLLHGVGANGKTTFLEALRNVFGSYAQIADFSTFEASRSTGGPRNDLARLRGSRFVTASEGEAGARLAEAMVKQVTGGDTVTARFLYSEYFDFKPQFKLWLATNHRPTIRGTDNGIWRRIRLIPFNVQIPSNEQDRHLATKLSAEVAGILRWVVVGLAAYREQGLQEPAAVTEASRQYRHEQDVIEGFLEDRCTCTPDARSRARDLYLAYKVYSDECGERAMNERQFSQTLAERGHRFVRRNCGKVWIGIGLADNRCDTQSSIKPIGDGGDDSDGIFQNFPS